MNFVENVLDKDVIGRHATQSLFRRMSGLRGKALIPVRRRSFLVEDYRKGIVQFCSVFGLRGRQNRLRNQD